MKNTLHEIEELKYRVIVNGTILNESNTLTLAEHFIRTLTQEQQALAEIVPISKNGKQILFG